MLKKFWNWLKGLFKTPDYFTRIMPMTKYQFGDMIRFFLWRDKPEVEFNKIAEDRFEVWKLIPASNEYGESISAAELVGSYNGETNLFHYTSGFDTLLDNYLKYY